MYTSGKFPANKGLYYMIPFTHRNADKKNRKLTIKILLMAQKSC